MVSSDRLFVVVINAAFYRNLNSDAPFTTNAHESEFADVDYQHPSYESSRLKGRPAAVLIAGATIVALILYLVASAAVGASEHDALVDDWEVWALDQGTDIDRIHVYQHAGDGEFREVESISFGELDPPHNEVQTPHMIDFDDSNRYAAIASTASGTVSVVRTSDYEVIDTIETGDGAHMALWAPDDSIWVANIGAQSFTQISSDLDNEVFEIEQDISLTADLQAEDWPGWNETYGEDLEDWPGPVCHEFTPDGQYGYVTMGPMAGGMVVVDLETGQIETAFNPEEVRANCGLALSHNHDQMYANWSGDLVDLDDPFDADPGEWYVFDIATHELAGTHSSASGEVHGLDPHGQRVSPDGSEMWQVNRVSQDGIVVDTATQEVIDTLELTDTPDIIGFSPDGEWLFVTLRGPNPASMPHVAEGQTPGVEVFDVDSRESVGVLQPFSDDEADASDFHGINVRGPIADPAEDEAVATPDDEADDAEDLVPATGGDSAQIGITAGILALIATLLLSTGALIRSRSGIVCSRFKANR